MRQTDTDQTKKIGPKFIGEDNFSQGENARGNGFAAYRTGRFIHIWSYFMMSFG
jgi:hypothetical protein